MVSLENLYCPHCNSRISVRSAKKLVGKKVRCKHCESTFCLNQDFLEQVSAGFTVQLSPGEQAVSSKNELSFSRYKIISELGRGGMGKVFQVLDTKLNRVVALKVLISGERANEIEVERFLREAHATAKLSHPNIVVLYDTGEEDGQLYFTMDFIQGGSLKDLLRSGKLSMDRILDIMIHVGDAIDVAHKHGIIHRDLKPANIMMKDGEVPIVMDFGLAKMAEVSRQISHTGMIAGTLQYMSPEQAEGMVHDIDARSDVFSLGAILYQMLTGQPPFDGESFSNILFQIIHKDPLAPNEIAPGIPEDLQNICLKALEKNPSKRYSSARAFVEDLIAFREGRAVIAPKKSFWSHWQKKVLQHQKYLIAVAFFLVFGVAFFMGKYGQSENDEKYEENQTKLLNSEITQKEEKGKNIKAEQTPINELSDILDKSIPEKIRRWHEEGEKNVGKPLRSALEEVREKAKEKLHEKLADLSEEKSFPSLLEKAKEEAQKKLHILTSLEIPGFDFLETKNYSCGGQKHQVQEYRHQKTEMIFVLLKGGTFIMGKKGSRTMSRKVTLAPFLISKYEVTQKVWQSVIRVKTSFFEGENHPVENVNRKEASFFCREVGLKLPSEAQWEYACRAGTETLHYWKYKNPKDYAWYSANTKSTKPVGQKKPNAFGLHDMIGNVWEWCHDSWHSTYLDAPRDGTPWMGSDIHVYRGGGWSSFQETDLRSISRNRGASSWKRNFIGFRPVYNLKEK